MPGSDEHQNKVMASYDIGLSTIYDTMKWTGQLQSVIASSESVKNLFEQQTLKEPKFVQVDKVLYTCIPKENS
jgi:hypothetical protein